MKTLIMVSLVALAMFLVGCAGSTTSTPSQAEKRAICLDSTAAMDSRQTWCGTFDNTGPDAESDGDGEGEGDDGSALE